MRPTSTALVLIIGLGLAPPVSAQIEGGADADQDQFVTGEEATVFDEQRFSEITGGADEMMREQFSGAMTGADDAEGLWSELDADRSGTADRTEWSEWRQQRFETGAGETGQIGLDDYGTLDAGGTIGDGTTGDTAGGGMTGGTTGNTAQSATSGDGTTGDTTGGGMTGGTAGGTTQGTAGGTTDGGTTGDTTGAGMIGGTTSGTTQGTTGGGMGGGGSN